jgi:hypothetical protein
MLAGIYSDVREHFLDFVGETRRMLKDCEHATGGIPQTALQHSSRNVGEAIGKPQERCIGHPFLRHRCGIGQHGTEAT